MHNNASHYTHIRDQLLHNNTKLLLMHTEISSIHSMTGIAIRTRSEDSLAMVIIAQKEMDDARKNLLRDMGSHVSVHHTSTGFPKFDLLGWIIGHLAHVNRCDLSSEQPGRKIE